MGESDAAISSLIEAADSVTQRTALRQAQGRQDGQLWPYRREPQLNQIKSSISTAALCVKSYSFSKYYLKSGP
jgi:hypothetical protein